MIDWYDSRNSTTITCVNDMPMGVYGFIYRLIYEDGTMYIGKKNIFCIEKRQALQNGTIRSNAKRIHKNIGGKRVAFDVVTKESNWLKYVGSHNTSKSLVVRREILCYAPSKRALSYLEAKYLFVYGAIEINNNYLNCNILGKFFKGNLI